MRAWLPLTVLVLFACEPSRPRAVVDAGVGPLCLTLPDVIDLGEAEEGVRVERSFRLVNPGSDIVHATIGAVTEPFDVLEHDVALAAGVTREVVFGFTPSDARLIVQDTAFSGGKGCPPQTVRLQGRGGGGIVVQPFIDLGAVPLNTPTTRSFSIVHTRHVSQDVQVLLSQSGSGFRIANPAFTLAPGATAVVDVIITADQPTEIVASVAIFGVLDRFSIGISAQGGVPQFAVSPAVLDVGELPQDLSRPELNLTRSVTFRNDGDGPLRVQGFEALDEQGMFTAEIQPDMVVMVGPHQQRLQPLALGPRGALGPRRWTVRFSSNALPATQEVELRANVTDRPPSNASVTALVVGTFADGGLAFTNTDATGDCLVDDVHFTDPWPADWELHAPLQFVLAPLETRTFALVRPSTGSTQVQYRVWGRPFSQFLPVSR